MSNVGNLNIFKYQFVILKKKKSLLLINTGTLANGLLMRIYVIITTKFLD